MNHHRNLGHFNNFRTQFAEVIENKTVKIRLIKIVNSVGNVARVYLINCVVF